MVFLAGLTISDVSGATYFLKASGASSAQTASSWNTAADGSGSNATNFTTSGDVFTVPVGISGTIASSVTMGTTSNTGAVTLNINGTLTIASGAVLTIQQKNNSTFALNVNSGGTLIFAGTSANQLTGSTSGSGTIARLAFNLLSGGLVETANANGLSGTGNESILSNSLTSSLDAAADYQFNGNSQNIAGIPASVRNISISGSSNKSLTSVLAISGTLTISSGATLDAGTNQVTGASLSTSGTGTFKTQNTGSTPIPSGRSWSFGVEFNAAGAQTIPAGTYTALACSTSGTKSLGGDATISSSLTIESGVILDAGTNAISGSSMTTTGTGTLKTQNTGSTPVPSGRTWAGTVEFNASGAQTIPAGTFGALICSTSGTKSLGGSATVSGALSLSSSKISIGANTLTLNGDFSGSASACIVGGSSASLSIGGSGSMSTSLFFENSGTSTDSTLNNLTLNRSSATVTLGNKLMVLGNLTPTAGTLTTGGNLILGSNASSTANVLSGSGTISGNVTVQRHIPSSARRWRFLSSPVTSATLADWQNEIHITGTGGATNGFDATGSNAASVFTYDETLITGDLNTGWTAATNITNTLTPGKGYRVFVRGSRTTGRLTGAETTQDAVVLNLVGTVNSGNINMNPTFTSSGTSANDGWNYMGNPYPSAIDWNQFFDNATDYTNLSPVVYIYSAASNSYLSYNALSNSGTLTNGIIPSGSAFWVQATAASPTMTMKETYKTSSTPAGLFKSQYADKDFRIRITKDSINSDDVQLKYIDLASPAKDAYDIPKMWGAEVNIAAIGTDLSYLALQSKPFKGDGDTIKLGVYARATGYYTLSFVNAHEFAANLPIYLLDYGTGRIVDLRIDTAYVVYINMSDAGTYGDSRFELVIGKMPAVINPVAVKELTDNQNGLQLYPYASQGTVTISGIESAYNEIEIRDMQGHLVSTFSNVAVTDRKAEIDIGHLSPAMYVIWVQQGPGGKPSALKCVRK